MRSLFKRSLSGAGCLLILTLTAACAPNVPWKNPNVPKEQWSKDWWACRTAAQQQAGYTPSAGPTPQSGLNSVSPIQDYERNQMRKAILGYTDLCMTEKGYIPIKE